MRRAVRTVRAPGVTGHACHRFVAGRRVVPWAARCLARQDSPLDRDAVGPDQARLPAERRGRCEPDEHNRRGLDALRGQRPGPLRRSPRCVGACVAAGPRPPNRHCAAHSARRRVRPLQRTRALAHGSSVEHPGRTIAPLPPLPSRRRDRRGPGSLVRRGRLGQRLAGSPPRGVGADSAVGEPTSGAPRGPRPSAARSPNSKTRTAAASRAPR